MDLARLYEEAGNAQKSFELLLQDLDSPGQAHAEEYWLLLAKVSTQFGQDAYASRAYEKALGLRPDDAEILENLQRLAVRHRDDKKSERLARYGWNRLQRVEDLQRLMRFSWKRQNWQELDQWLALADEMRSTRPSAMAQAPGLLVLSLRAQDGRVESGTRPVMRCGRYCVCGVRIRK